MSTIPFIAALVCVALIIIWYVQDEATQGGTGESGILGMKNRADGGASGGREWKPRHDKHPWRVTRR